MRLFLLLLVILPINQLTAQLVYTKAKKEQFDTTVMGIRISDPYFWMVRKEREEEMLEFARQEGKLAEEVLNKVPGLHILQKEINESYAGFQ